MLFVRTLLLVLFSASVIVAHPRGVAAAEDEATPTVSRAVAPVYVADWGRLADLVRSDSLVSPRADFWASRHQSAQWVLAIGLSAGIGATVVGTANWLIDDEWSKNNKRMVAAGVAVTAVALFAYWAFDPDRDDFVTVINQWNLRHPDRLLAP